MVKIGLNADGLLGKNSLGKDRKITEEFIAELYDKLVRYSLVCEWKAVYAEGIHLSGVWEELFPIPVFQEYGEYRWCKELLRVSAAEKIRGPYGILALGNEAGDVISGLAGEAVELVWYAEESDPPNDCILDLEDEFGLIAQVKTFENCRRLSGKQIFTEKQLCDMFGDLPVVVIDFLEEGTDVPDFTLPECRLPECRLSKYRLPKCRHKDCRWLDFAPFPGKYDTTGISRISWDSRLQYDSLIKYWDGCKRRVVVPDYRTEW